MKTMLTFVMIACVETVAAGWTAAGEPGGGAPAEPMVAWPEEWTAFGSFSMASVAGHKEPSLADFLPGEALKAIPEELAVGDRRLRGQKLRLGSTPVNLNDPMPSGGWPQLGSTAYLMAPVTATEDTTIQIGAGANWWMQWWVDGKPIYSTLGRFGNGTFPITGRDHVFDVPLTKGKHVLAVAVISARKAGFLFAVTSPRELRANPLTFQYALDAGGRKCRENTASGLMVTAVNYASARESYRQALDLADDDEERAEARLAMAGSYLLNPQEINAADAAAIRREYAEVMALKDAPASQKARAALGIGDTWLLENNCARAREEFTRARNLATQPEWTNAAQFALARAHAQEKNNAAARAELTQLLARDGLDETLQFDAQLHLEALDVAPRVRVDHPRLFFNADTWPAVKARVEGDVGAFQRLQDNVRNSPALFTPTRADGLMEAALVYRITPDPALLGRLREALRSMVDQYLAGTRPGDYRVEPRVCWLAALDWVWNDLPPAERDGLVHDMLRFAYGQHARNMLAGRKLADNDDWYYARRMHWFVGIVALNPGMDAVDYMRAMAELGRGYDNNVVRSFGHNLGLMADCGGITQIEYGIHDTATPAWTFLHSWRSAVGAIPDEWALGSGFAPGWVLRNVLGFGEDHRGLSSYRNFGYGLSWRKKGGWLYEHRLYDNLGQFLHFFARCQPEEAAIAAYLRHKMEQAGCVGPGSYAIYPYLLDPAGAAEPGLPDGLPVARHYAGNGQVLMSSGFDTNEATFALYSCGGSRARGIDGPHNFDTGHFTIYKKGYLALDSGTRAATARGTAGWNYDPQSVAHNTVLIRMEGEVMPDLYGESGAMRIIANSGGQRKMPDFARVLAFETQQFFAYTATDATQTYHPDKCARTVRQFVYLPPDHFVVFDRVVSKNAEYPKTWLLHTANEPVFNGKEFRADQDRGRIFCRTLLPADAVLEKIGGPGKEFWADGRNWPIASDSPHFGDIGMEKGGELPENIGRWRVEVTPGAARTEDCFLHLIQASDQTVEKMVESRVSDRGNQVELTFTVGARTYAIALNKTGEVGGHIKITEGAKVLVDRPLTQEVMEQHGLALNAGR